MMAAVLQCALAAHVSGDFTSMSTDIMGYVYHYDYSSVYYLFPNDESTLGCMASPMHGATVRLYKRLAEGGWEPYGTPVQTVYGFYRFEEVDTGRGANSLCTNSDWFRVQVDASTSQTSLLPGTDERLLDRFSHNTPRPAGIPDEGSIRVDFVFSSASESILEGRPLFEGSHLNPSLFTGNWVAQDENAVFFSLNQGSGMATCPIGENPVDVGNCIVGHWSNSEAFQSWDYLQDYAEYAFWPFNGDPEDTFAWFYHYWTNSTPFYALHYQNGRAARIADFVYIQPGSSAPFEGNMALNVPSAQPLSNPVRGRLVVNVEETRGPVSLFVSDLTGRTVHTATGVHEGVHDLGDMPGPGVYHITTLPKNGAPSSVKIIVL